MICEYCGHSPHLPGCPAAAEQEPVFYCACCGAEILEGDTYYEIRGQAYCESCVMDCRREA